MKMTDAIEAIIKELLYEHDGTAQIQRNELANQLGCVPSQINYVITSRFTPEQGYIIESRRGGGGFIKIQKVDNTKKGTIMHLINSLPESIDENTIRVILQNLYHDNILTEREARIILSAVTDNTLREVSLETKSKLRVRILKSMLLNSI